MTQSATKQINLVLELLLSNDVSERTWKSLFQNFRTLILAPLTAPHICLYLYHLTSPTVKRDILCSETRLH
jgi:hypothetical protein